MEAAVRTVVWFMMGHKPVLDKSVNGFTMKEIGTTVRYLLRNGFKRMILENGVTGRAGGVFSEGRVKVWEY